MEILEAIKGRRCHRRFSKKPVPKDLLKRILQDALWAPSGMNFQNWYFVIISGEYLEKMREISKEAYKRYVKKDVETIFKGKEKIIQETKQFFYTLGNAPVVICAYREDTVEGELTDIQSVAAATYNILLLAYESGLASCWMTGPVWMEKEINKVLGIKDKKLQAFIPIGYPVYNPPVPKRKGDKIKWLG